MLIELCEKPIIEKTRYRIAFGGHTWEVDVFHGDNEGLVVAEVELENRDEQVELPPWVTEEVTGDPRYYNVSLVKEPYRDW
jgi:adenylate cyclase